MHISFSFPPLLFFTFLLWIFASAKKILSGSSDNSVSPGTKWNLSLSLLYFLSSVPFSSNSIPARLQGDRDASGKELTNQSQQMVIQWTKRWELPFLFFFSFGLWKLEKIGGKKSVLWVRVWFFTTSCFSHSWPALPPASSWPDRVKVSLTGSAERMSTEKFDGRTRCAHSQSFLTHLSN